MSLVRRVLAILALATTAVMPHAQAPPASVVKVAGDAHKLAVLSDGRVFGWRQFRFGQLGPITGRIFSPGQFASGALLQELPGKAVDVAAGNFASYALLEDGSVWAWGRGNSGQLGTGPNPDLPLLPTDSPSFEYRGAERPRRVRVDAAMALAAAGNTAFAVLRDGTVRAWGMQDLLGDGGATASGAAFAPVPVMGAADVTQISASATHVLVLTKDGRVLAWGNNTSGALGRDPTKEPRLDRASEVPGLTDVIAIAAAYHVSTALKKDGTVWVWGSNANGLFGEGKRTASETVGARFTAQPVPGIANVVAITTGFTGRHTIVLLKDGSLRGWGNTDWGQIGAGVSGTFQDKPVTPRLSGVRAIFAVGNNTFAVKTDGTFWGWGYGGAQDWPFKAVTRVPTEVDLR
jgi:alpha-tubulin suppressor-like RCC1 family protein